MHTNLKNISDNELVSQLESLTKQEHKITLSILLHLIEVEAREIHVALGYSSLFSYLTEKFKYSEGAACRRITAARCIRDYPQVYELLKENKVNLTNITVFAKILTKENVGEVLSNVTGKSRREVEAYVALYNPKSVVRESIRPIAIKQKSSTKTSSDQQTLLPTNRHSEGDFQSDVQEEVEERFEFRFSASKDFKEKFNEVRQVLSNKYPGGVAQEQIFMEAMEMFLEQKSPKRREARREKRKQKKVKSSKSSSARIAPKQLKDKVLKRDGQRCTYVGKDGKRCSSTWDLQIDHVKPWAMSGETTFKNLRVLCRNHNMFLAKKSFGKELLSSGQRCKAGLNSSY